MLRRLAQRRSALGDAIVVPVIDRLRGNPDRRDPRVSKLQLVTSNSVYLSRRKHRVQALAYPRQINLVGLKRLDGGTYGDCKRPAAWVKPRIGFGRAGAGFSGAFRIVAGTSPESSKPSGCGKPGSEP